MRRLLCAAVVFVLAMPVWAARSDFQAKPATPAKPGTPAPAAGPTVVFTTARGAIEIELFPADAPKSVARIAELAKQGFYRATRFYFVGPYVVQFGDQLSRDMTKKDQWGKGGSGPRQGVRPLGVNEINKRQFVRGVVGMAHQPWEDPEAGDCQLFIVKVANPALNGKYVAIGRVAKGMDVVDKLEVEDVIKDVSVK